MTLPRRSFLTGAALAPIAAIGAVNAATRAAAGLEAGDGPYGPLATTPDALGLLLPAGFSARVVATSGLIVPGTSYEWHVFPDAGATFPTETGGWIYVSNSEAGEGTSGVGALVFDADGVIVEAYAVLSGSTRNCGGGVTPWGSWLSGEEVERGLIWECDPTGVSEAVAHEAMGRFIHEAAAVDPDRQHVYLTEDAPDGRFYRYTPTAYPDLSTGALECAQVDGDGVVTWLTVPDPMATTDATRAQVSDSTAFDGGEGIWYHDGVVWFTTKGDHGVWRLDVAADPPRIEQVYRGVDEELALGEPDTITISADGYVFVCEDQAEDQQVVVITPDGVMAPVLQLTGQLNSEVAGVALDPSGTRMYVSSQRGGSGGGVTYEVTGPFTTRPLASTTSAAPSSVSPTTAAIASTTRAVAGGADADSDDGLSPAIPIGIGTALVGAVGYGLHRLRSRPQPPSVE